jgi:glycerol-3-phosphate acyltransferase PlsY
MHYLDVLRTSLALLIGYLPGSFLPGYFLPRWVRKIDIRRVGDGNPGTINVKKSCGAFLGLVTSLVDLSKGLLAIFIIHTVFKLPNSFAYLGGLSAVLGHKFPFYLGFRGGRGIATTIGLFLYIFIKILIQNFTPLGGLPLLVFIVTLGLLVILATHGKGDFFTVLGFPCIGLFMLLKLHVLSDLVFILALICIITVEAGRNLARDYYRNTLY